MNNINSALLDDYKRVCATYNPDDTGRYGYISENDVLKAHYIISDYFLDAGEKIVYGVKNFPLLSSAVARQATSYGGLDKWNNDYQKMATLLFGLVQNHAFHDGNKRTALLILLLYIDRLNLKLCVKQTKLETLIVRIAANTLYEYSTLDKYKDNDEPIFNFIADQLKSYTKPINKRYYLITYAEFNQKLNKFNVKLDNPHDNHIDVYQLKTNRRIKIFNRKEEYIKILQIGFPGWKRQIHVKAVKEVLKAAHLTAEYGVDSDVFYHDYDPIYTLINEYREPLARLKDK